MSVNILLGRIKTEPARLYLVLPDLRYLHRLHQEGAPNPIPLGVDFSFSIASCFPLVFGGKKQQLERMGKLPLKSYLLPQFRL